MCLRDPAAVSQRDYTQYYQHILKQEQHISQAIQDFFSQHVQYRFLDEDCESSFIHGDTNELITQLETGVEGLMSLGSFLCWNLNVSSQTVPLLYESQENSDIMSVLFFFFFSFPVVFDVYRDSQVTPLSTLEDLLDSSIFCQDTNTNFEFYKACLC